MPGTKGCGVRWLTDNVGAVVVEGLRLVRRVQPRHWQAWVVADVLEFMVTASSATFCSKHVPPATSALGAVTAVCKTQHLHCMCLALMCPSR